MNELEEIRDEIIKQAFPELLDEDVRIEYKHLDDALIECGGLTPEGFYIEVDNSLKDAPRVVKEGGIAHDLGHIVVQKQLGSRKSLRDRLAYKISPRYKTLDERNTDLMIIIRNYGRPLIEFMRYAEKKGFPYYKEEGLSIRELEIILSLGSPK